MTGADRSPAGSPAEGGRNAAAGGASAGPVTLTAVTGMPEVAEGADLADLVVAGLRRCGVDLADGDVLVVSSKVVSKARGLSVPLAGGTGPAQARADAVAGQGRRVVAERMTPGGLTQVVESVAGPVMAAAGVDASNTGGRDVLLLLPADPDAEAHELRAGIRQRWREASGTTAPRIGVVVSDTAGRPWRVGQTDFALGVAGVVVVDDLRGGRDADGRDLAVTERCVADELAAAADLVKGKTLAVPVAHVRGLTHLVVDEPVGPAAATGGEVAGRPRTRARDIVRTGAGDWFGLGRSEAVREALGVAAGSALARRVGIPSVLPEGPERRVDRAIAVALAATADVVVSRVGAGVVRLVCADAYRLGLATARLEVALRGEDLVPRVERTEEGVSLLVELG